MSKSSDHVYWPEIDGLRAIAVSLVILNHIHHSLAPGGFIGVDMFFVISGLVVTNSIIQGETTSVRKDLINFWRRRCLRIVPAMIVMVFCASMLFGFFYPPASIDQYNATLRTGVMAIFGVSNFYLYHAALDYFQSDGAINLFIHTWSLGIEEQFYLVHALMVIAFPRLISSSIRLPAVRIALLIVLSILSLTFFLVWHETNSIWAYFMLPARFWELASGALLAMTYRRLAAGVAFSDVRQLVPKKIAFWLQLGALVLLAAAVLLPFWKQTGFAIPVILGVLATNILIVTFLFGSAPVATIFTLKPVLFVGALSYSLYLWHWPVLIVMSHTVGLTVTLVIIYVMIVWLLAWASYTFVEVPWRSRKSIPTPVLATWFALAIACAVTPAALLLRWPGLLYTGNKQDWQADWLSPKTFSYGGDGKLVAATCSLRSSSSVPDEVPDMCRLPVPNVTGSTRRLLLVGDSHAFADWEMLVGATRAMKMELLVLGHDGCRPATENPNTSCEAYLSNIPVLMRHSLRRNDIIMVAHLWSQKGDAEFAAMARHLETIARQAERLGVSVVVEGPLPVFQRSAFVCLPEWFRRDYSECTIPRKEYEASSRNSIRVLESISRRHPGTFRIWLPIDNLCDGNSCHLIEGSRPLFRDDNHLSQLESRELAPTFSKWLGAQ